MHRDKQIELMKSVEERTAAHAAAWINRSPRLHAALHRQNDDRITSTLDVAALYLRRGFMIGWLSALFVETGALWLYYRWHW